MSDNTPKDRPSSAAAGQIEDFVRKKLAAYPGLAIEEAATEFNQ